LTALVLKGEFEFESKADALAWKSFI